MLHARMVHPKTLGSTLVSAGELDKTRFPNAQVVVKGNLVGVVAPTEWEAIRAAQQVASATKWTDWKGLPGNANLHRYLKDSADWKSAPVSKSDKNHGDVTPALAAAAKKLSATYEFSYLKHAPIGPTMAVADVRADGEVHIYAHNQNPQALRGEIATMLGISTDHVVVHAFPAPATTAGPTAAMPARKMKRSFCRKPSAGRFACNGCGPTTSSGLRSLRLQSRTSKSVSTTKARSSRIRSTITCRRPGRPADWRGDCRLADDASSRAESAACQHHRFHRQPPFRSVGLRRRCPWRNSVMARSRSASKLRRLASGFAITACARRDNFSRIFRANWPSARRRR